MKTEKAPPALGDISCLRVFGSVARGDSDSKSDVDILAVLADRSKFPERQISDYVARLFGKRASITWYSYERMRELFRQGHLFAWHIFLESKQLERSEIDIVEKLGEPSKYTTGQEDMAALLQILSSVKKATLKCPRNAVYEGGLIYVCTKNIALIASSLGGNALDFSRYSPYNLNIQSLEFPIPRHEYDLLIQARHAGMRGLASPHLNESDVITLQIFAVKWAKKVQSYFHEERA